MNFEDIKDQITEALASAWEQFKDSSVYTQVKERFDLLSPKQQKYTIIGISVFAFYLVISIPIGFLSEANQRTVSYEKTMSVFDKLVETKKMKESNPQVKPIIEAGRLSRSLKILFEKEGITKEQIKKTESFKEQNSGALAFVPGDAEVSGVLVELSQLNLKQIVSLVYGVDRQSRPGKMTHLKLDPNAEKAGFFDLKFEVRNFEIPIEEAKSEPEPRRRGRKSK